LLGVKGQSALATEAKINAAVEHLLKCSDSSRRW
jgi:hypothetical protein